MIISHYNVIVLCRQLAPGLCVRCVAAYSWDDQQYDPCGTCTGRMSMPRPPPQHFYDYTLLAVLALLVLLPFLPLLHMHRLLSTHRAESNDFMLCAKDDHEMTKNDDSKGPTWFNVKRYPMKEDESRKSDINSCQMPVT